MPAKRLGGIAALLYLLLWQGYWPGKAEAQLAVAEVNSPFILVQLINQIVQTVELVQQGIANLMAFTNMGLISAVLGSVEALMDTLQDIADDIAAISRDWNALIEEDQLPTTARELFEWNSRASGLMLRATSKAYTAISLLRTVIQLLRDAQRLFLLIQALGGQLASLQLIASQMAILVTETIKSETLAAAYHQAMLAPVVVEAVNERAAEHLARQRLENFGVVGPHLDLR